MSKELVYVFEELSKSSKKFLCSNRGTEFEERVIDCFRRHNFNRMVTEHDPKLKAYVQKIKSKVLNKLSDSLIVNELGKDDIYYRNIIIHQPYGSQNYPDILVFTDYILPVELKFSKDKSPHPMWNGNLPKECGVYIFGQYGNERLTYFVGSDVLTAEDREFLVNTTKTMRDLSNTEPTENGFALYYRETYSQQGTFDYFDDKQRVREQNTVEFVRRI